MEQHFHSPIADEGAPPFPPPSLLPPPILPPPPGQPPFPPTHPFPPHQNFYQPPPGSYPPHIPNYPPPPRGFYPPRPRPYYGNPRHQRGGRGWTGRGGAGRWKRPRDDRWSRGNYHKSDFKRHRDNGQGSGGVEALYSQSMFEDPWRHLLTEEEAKAHEEQLAAHIRQRCGCTSDNGAGLPHSSTETKGEQEPPERLQDPSASDIDASDSSVDQKCTTDSIGTQSPQSDNQTPSEPVLPNLTEDTTVTAPSSIEPETT